MYGLTMQSSTGDHKSFELYPEFDEEPVKSNHNQCQMRPFETSGQEFSNSILDNIQICFVVAGEKGAL